MKRTAVIAVCAFLIATAVPAAGDEADSPARLARKLVIVQDEIALGSTAALDAVPELRRRLAIAIEKAPDSIWQEPKHGRTLVLYLLNGGAPRVVRRLVDSGVDLGHFHDLVSALLSHAERATGDAQKLAKFDARQLDPGIAGPFALVQAIALAADPEKARALLSQARLLNPGGLVEESAIRREMEILIIAGNKQAAASLGARYLWRFGSSLYAKDVVAFLANTLLPELATLPDGKGAIVRLTDEMPVPGRIDALMKVAHSAMLRGDVQLTEFIAGRAYEYAAIGSAEQSRAEFYLRVVRAFAAPSEATVGKVRESEILALSTEDRALLHVSLLALERVLAPIDPSGSSEAASTVAIQAATRAINAAQEQLDQLRP